MPSATELDLAPHLKAPALPVATGPLRLVQHHYDVLNLPLDQQLLAWRERMGQVIDVVTSKAQIALPFRAEIDRYDVGPYMFADCYTDQILLDRSIARISRDNARSLCFHVFMDGDSAETLLSHPARRDGPPVGGGVLAVDLDQPVRVLRGACRHGTVFVPARRVTDVFPDPGALHGRTLSPLSPAVQLITQRMGELFATIRTMSPDEAFRGVDALVQLIVDAFGADAGLAGSRRAVARALEFRKARRFVLANLQDADLSPDRVLDRLGLSRPTMYRLFQHEGGLGAYIRHARLRAAANDLVRFPGVPVMDIAYAVGFRSASDFTRAFRRAYGLSPQDVRQYAGWRPEVD